MQAADHTALVAMVVPDRAHRIAHVEKEHLHWARKVTVYDHSKEHHSFLEVVPQDLPHDVVRIEHIDSWDSEARLG